MSISTTGLSRTVSGINVAISRKSQIFPHPRVLCAPLKGFPLELGTGAQGQKRMMGLPGQERSLMISSAIWIQLQFINVMDGQTDRRTDIGWQQRPRLRIASRGKNELLAKGTGYFLNVWRNSYYVSYLIYMTDFLTVKSYFVYHRNYSEFWISVPMTLSDS